MLYGITMYTLKTDGTLKNHLWLKNRHWSSENQYFLRNSAMVL